MYACVAMRWTLARYEGRGRSSCCVPFSSCTIADRDTDRFIVSYSAFGNNAVPRNANAVATLSISIYRSVRGAHAYR